MVKSTIGHFILHHCPPGWVKLGGSDTGILTCEGVDAIIGKETSESLIQ